MVQEVHYALTAKLFMWQYITNTKIWRGIHHPTVHHCVQMFENALQIAVNLHMGLGHMFLIYRFITSTLCRWNDVTRR